MKSLRPTIVFAVSNDLNFDQRMHRICTSLTENGFRCLLVGRSKRSSVPLAAQVFEQKRLVCFFEKGAAFYVELNIRLFFFLLLQKRFSVRGGFFYAVDLDTIAPVFFAGRLRGARLIYDAHEYFSEVPEVVDRPVVKRIWEAVARFFIPKMDAHLTVGPALAGVLGERYGVHFEAIRNMPFRNQLPAGSRKLPDFGTKIMLYQGALNVGRGLEQAISAMPFLPKNVELWLAGEGDLSAELRLLATEKKVGERVRFFGLVRPTDLPALTEKAWLGLNLLEDRGLSYHYSLANKFFDYIQSGVPSLNMDLPEYRAINSEFKVAILLTELSPKSIVREVERMLVDESLYEKLTENCRRAAELFNWENESKKLADIFRKISN